MLADVRSPSPAADEEMFGPVASLFRARDIDEAIRLANATRFGLGASAWTNDAAERARLTDEIEAGQSTEQMPRPAADALSRTGDGEE